MKKFTLLLSLSVATVTTTSAQCFKYPLFEHFTQASCGPCASQNPTFQENILGANPNTVRHIAYHTSWPGYDPMYEENETQSDERVSFYSVSGVPDIFLQGNYKEAQPGGMTMTDVNTIIAQTSPIKITVEDIDNGTTHDVNVTIKSVGAPPSGSWKLVNAVIERNIDYLVAPGSNGEKYFPNVMRMMIPSTNGTVVTLPAQGSESTFTYQYDEDVDWDMAEIGVVSFLQHSTTKEIINAGSTFDEVQNAIVIPPVTSVKDGAVGSPSSFSFSTGNSGNANEDFLFTLSTDAPGDWSGSFTVNGITSSSSTTINMAANSNLAGSIDVTPGATPAFAIYTLTIAPASNPDAPAMLVEISVISGVTDLVVNNAAGNGVTPGDASEWEEGFTNGMDFAGSTSYDVVYHTSVQKALEQLALTNVDHLYLNIGWTFPGLTDEFVNELRTFMDNGGNVMVSGQDIAWETFDEVNSPYWSQNKQDFFNDYLNIGFISDGNSTNKPLTANMDDIFTAVPSATINAYYGSTYFYPDQITALNQSIPAFYYNSNVNKIAGVRSDNGHKVVYLGVGLEMIGTDADKNNIMKTTYDWFHGNITSAEFDEQMASLGQNFPNPCDDVTYIPLPGIEGVFTLTNALGQVIMFKNVGEGTTLLEIRTSDLPQGIYHYYLKSEERSTAHSMQVVH